MLSDITTDIEAEIKPSLSNINPILDIHSLTISSGEKLPHWQCNNAIYHISFRLADSVPQSVIKGWLCEHENLILNVTQHQHNQHNQHDKELLEEAERKAQYLYSERIEKYLDVGYGKCYLGREDIAKMVAYSFTHFDKKRYRLHAWCIMPNHVHIIAEVMPKNDLSKIIHSWKSYTAHKANEILNLTGAFWQHDAYNHIIRSRKEYHFQIQYTWENPEKAKLRNWQWRWKTDNGFLESS